MRAAALRAVGEPLVVDDVALRAIGPADVHVRLAASGVCRSDLSIQDGTIPHPIPAVLGHEGAGVVLECGAHVQSLTPGDHVILSWVAPCRRCFYCLRGHPELCEHGLDHAFAQPYATASDGTPLLAAFGTATFGEETIVPEAAVIVWLPTLARVAENVPVPSTNVASGGNVANVSVLVKCTVPV